MDEEEQVAHFALEAEMKRLAKSGKEYLNSLKGDEAYSLPTLEKPEAVNQEEVLKQRQQEFVLTVIRCEVLASQRGEIYRVYLVINQNGHYIKAPYSCCSCAAGNMFCAHMLGLLCFCQFCKLNPT